MSYKIRNLDISPKWFDQSKYERSQDLDTEGWWHELHKRWFLDAYLMDSRHRGPKHAIKSIGTDDLESFLANSANALDPRKPYVELFFTPIGSTSLSTEELQTLEQRGPVIQSLTLENAIFMVDTIRQFSNEVNGEIAFQLPLDNAYRAILIGDDSAHASIDLSASDEILIEAFKTWLPLVRSELGLSGPKRQSDRKKVPGSGKKFSKNDFRKWNRYQVLPILDLLLWGKLENVPITSPLIANALDDDEDKVDDTKRPLAELLITQKVVSALGRQCNAAAPTKGKK